MLNIIKNKNKGILFWITGLSGSGKTTIAKKIRPFIAKTYGPTIIINGDDMRNIFKLRKFDKASRLENGKKYIQLCKLITNQKINVVFPVIGLFYELHNWNRKNINNYCEIYIKTSIKNIIKQKKKKIYNKHKINIVGLDIKPEFPKKADIIVKNNFEKNIKEISIEIIKKLK